MSKSLTLLRFSLGQLLAGRRLIIIAVLVALPLVLPAVFAARADVDPATFTLDLFRQLVLPVLLPVVALTFSTSSLGSELRDGTITNLLLKPIPRPAVLGAKYLAAVLSSLLVLLPAEAVGHVVAARGLGSTQLLGGMLLATTVGALAYCALGVLLSLLMARALLVGLAYALLWEGAVVSVAPSASSLSIRGYTEGVLAAVLKGEGLDLTTRLGPVSATVLAAWSPWPPWSWPSAASSGWTSPDGTGSIASSRWGRASRTVTTMPSSSRPVTAVTTGSPTRSPSQPCTTSPRACPPPTPSMNRLAIRARSPRGARSWQTVLVPESTAR